MIIDNDIDVLVITESWLSGDHRDEPTLAELKLSLPHYDIINHPRSTHRGGGICVLYRSTARCTVNDSYNCSSFQLLDITIHLTSSSTVRVYCIYRPPNSHGTPLQAVISLKSF